MISYEEYAIYRDKQNLTDYKVCKEANVATSTMTNWKNGSYTPKVEKLSAIAKIVKIPKSKLL